MIVCEKCLPRAGYLPEDAGPTHVITPLENGHYKVTKLNQPDWTWILFWESFVPIFDRINKNQNAVTRKEGLLSKIIEKVRSCLI